MAYRPIHIKMTAPKPGLQQVKYELLEENKRTAVKARHLWLAVLLMILIVCTSIIALYTAWQHMINASRKEENLDFLMIGPKRSLSGGPSWLSLRRGEMYGLAELEMSQVINWSEPPLVVNRTEHTEGEYKRVCYYVLPRGNNFHNITPEMLLPDLCTHITIAFATIVNGTLQPFDSSDLQGYQAILALKKKNPLLKVLVSVEWFSSSGEFAWVVSSPENRTRFVDETVQFLEENALDGLDIDWEFPSWPTEVLNQTACFTQLLRELSENFHQRAAPLLLSVAVAAPKSIIDQAYNISTMADYIDYVNVMAYDYHMYQSYLPMTGANAPLYQRQAEVGYFTTLNLNWTAFYWLYKGMPAHKIIIGIPTYGHSFTLVNEDNHGWDAPSSGIGSIGSDGFVTYDDVCVFISQHAAKSEFDYDSKVPYTYKGKEWISFDNEQSVAYKAQFAKQHMFGGVMIFSLNADDVTGQCEGGRFPLTQRVKSVMEDDQL